MAFDLQSLLRALAAQSGGPLSIPVASDLPENGGFAGRPDLMAGNEQPLAPPPDDYLARAQEFQASQALPQIEANQVMDSRGQSLPPVESESPPSLFKGANVSQILQNMGVGAGEPSFNAGRPTNAPNVPLSLDDQVMGAQREYQDAIARPAGKQKWWKDAAIISAQIASNIANPGNQVKIQGWGSQKKGSNIRKALEKLAPLEQLQKVNQDKAYRAAQIRNIYDDNTARDTRNKDLDNAAKAKNLTTGLKNFTDRLWKGQKYFDPKNASELDRRELEKFGMKPEDIGTFDFRDPKTKTVNGVTFQWDAKNQAYAPSDIPKDGSKEIVEYKVTDPDGVPHTFKVTSDRAAGFLTSIKAAGMSIEAAAARQNDQQSFTADQNERTRNLRVQLQQNAQKYGKDKTIQMATDAFKRLYAKENGGALPPQSMIDAYLSQEIMGGLGENGIQP